MQQCMILSKYHTYQRHLLSTIYYSSVCYTFSTSIQRILRCCSRARPLHCHYTHSVVLLNMILRSGQKLFAQWGGDCSYYRWSYNIFTSANTRHCSYNTCIHQFISGYGLICSYVSFTSKYPFTSKYRGYYTHCARASNIFPE